MTTDHVRVIRPTRVVSNLIVVEVEEMTEEKIDRERSADPMSGIDTRMSGPVTSVAAPVTKNYAAGRSVDITKVIENGIVERTETEITEIEIAISIETETAIEVATTREVIAMVVRRLQRCGVIGS